MALRRRSDGASMPRSFGSWGASAVDAVLGPRDLHGVDELALRELQPVLQGERPEPAHVEVAAVVGHDDVGALQDVEDLLREPAVLTPHRGPEGALVETDGVHRALAVLVHEDGADHEHAPAAVEAEGLQVEDGLHERRPRRDVLRPGPILEWSAIGGGEAPALGAERGREARSISGRMVRLKDRATGRTGPSSVRNGSPPGDTSPSSPTLLHFGSGGHQALSFPGMMIPAAMRAARRAAASSAVASFSLRQRLSFFTLPRF